MSKLKHGRSFKRISTHRTKKGPFRFTKGREWRDYLENNHQSWEAEVQEKEKLGENAQFDSTKRERKKLTEKRKAVGRSVKCREE